MKEIIDARLAELAANGNLRHIPADSCCSGRVDLSSNDYLGLAEDQALKDEFFGSCFDLKDCSLAMSASASRLLAARQKVALELEETIATAYGRPALLFNSGYHANVGMISALGAIKDCYILADKLVHASIIDGIRLSGARFARFRHNNYEHLAGLAAKACAEGCKVLIVAESVYSMDGDRADISALAEVRNNCPGAMLYVDEAHAVGVEGPAGLGLSAGLRERAFRPDIIVGTFGKALASFGAYAVVDEAVKHYMINAARSFIFSTSLPPVNIKWSDFIFKNLSRPIAVVRVSRLMQKYCLRFSNLSVADLKGISSP